MASPFAPEPIDLPGFLFCLPRLSAFPGPPRTHPVRLSFRFRDAGLEAPAAKKHRVRENHRPDAPPPGFPSIHPPAGGQLAIPLGRSGKEVVDDFGGFDADEFLIEALEGEGVFVGVDA